MLNPYKICEVARLISQGLTNRQIEKITGVSRATVGRYRKDPNRGMNTQSHRRPKAYKLDSGDQAQLKALLSKAKGNCAIARSHILKNPLQYGLSSDIEISQRSVRRYALERFPALFAQTAPAPTAPFHCEPGQQVQIDFVRCKFLFDGADIEEEIFLFEAVYSWSRKAYVCVCPDMTQTSWLLAIAKCLSKHGIPRQILCDNDKSLVLENNRRNKTLRFHPAFQWLCKPLGISPIAAMPARPQTKGRVERFGRYIKISGLVDVSIGRSVRNRQELQNALDQWLESMADQRVFQIGDAKCSVAELYEKEKPFLKFPEALATSFDITTWTAQINDHGILYLFGNRIELGLRMAGMFVYVSLRANGEYLITAGDTRTLYQGTVPSENLLNYRRDQAPDESPVVNSSGPVLASEPEITDIEEIFGE